MYHSSGSAKLKCALAPPTPLIRNATVSAIPSASLPVLLYISTTIATFRFSCYSTPAGLYELCGSKYHIFVARLPCGSATMTVERVGVSFEPELLDRFDALIKTKGYTNRSEAIRDLVRKSLIESEVEDEKGDVIGTLT
ncbi:MAG: ribbon-helix-helix protein, CopG family, partial [Thermoplasmata archaeon]